MKKITPTSIIISLFWLAMMTEIIMQKFGQRFLFPLINKERITSLVMTISILSSIATTLFLLQCVMWIPSKTKIRIKSWLKSLDRDIIIPEWITLLVKIMGHLIHMTLWISPIIGLWGIVIVRMFGISIERWMPEMFLGFFLWLLFVTLGEDIFDDVSGKSITNNKLTEEN